MDNNLTKTQKEILKDFKVQKYKITDKVRVKKGLRNISSWIEETYGKLDYDCCCISDNMEKLEGRIVTITDSWVGSNGIPFYNIKEDDSTYSWQNWMFESNTSTKKEDKRIFTPKLTIDISQNKATIKAVATPSKSSKKQGKQKTSYSKCDTCYDKFDFKIGALLSVAKVLGFNQNEIDNLIEALEYLKQYNNKFN